MRARDKMLDYNIVYPNNVKFRELHISNLVWIFGQIKVIVPFNKAFVDSVWINRVPIWKINFCCKRFAAFCRLQTADCRLLVRTIWYV